MFIRTWVSLVVAAWFCVAPTVVAANEANDDSVLLFILAGQSNMEGLGLVADLPDSLDKPQHDVQIWFNSAKGFQPLAGGFGHKPEWFGPEVTLGRTLKDGLPDREIVFVKAAHSGTNLARNWHHQDGKLYTKLNEKIALARASLEAQGKTVRIAGMFWIQGESDTRNRKMADAYADNLKSFIEKVRNDYQSPEMPFVFTRVHAKLGSPEAHVNNNHSFKFVPIVREAQQHVAATVPETQIIDTDDLALRLSPPHYDNLVHYDTKGVLDLGESMARAYLDNFDATARGATPSQSAQTAQHCARHDGLPGHHDVDCMRHSVLKAPATDAMAATNCAFIVFKPRAGVLAHPRQLSDRERAVTNEPRP